MYDGEILELYSRFKELFEDFQEILLQNGFEIN